jgi:hypothetical protein
LIQKNFQNHGVEDECDMESAERLPMPMAVSGSFAPGVSTESRRVAPRAGHFFFSVRT